MNVFDALVNAHATTDAASFGRYVAVTWLAMVRPHGARDVTP